MRVTKRRWRLMDGKASSRRLSPPELIGDTIAKAVSAPLPKTRYAVGFSAQAHGLYAPIPLRSHFQQFHAHGDWYLSHIVLMVAGKQ